MKSLPELIEIIKNVCMSFKIGENKENLTLLQRKNLKQEQRPKCLILDEINNFFEKDPTAVKKLLNFLYKEPKKKKNTDGEDDLEMILKESSEKTLKTQRPIILISGDIYAKGLRELRLQALNFTIHKDPEVVSERLAQICAKEVNFNFYC